MNMKTKISARGLRAAILAAERKGNPALSYCLAAFGENSRLKLSVYFLLNGIIEDGAARRGLPEPDCYETMMLDDDLSFLTHWEEAYRIAKREEEKELDRFAEKGQKAWADVGEASAWVEELRGGKTEEESAK